MAFRSPKKPLFVSRIIIEMKQSLNIKVTLPKYSSPKNKDEKERGRKRERKENVKMIRIFIILEW